ncbi:hypothetical protein JB92DRAFT_2854594 [Gautieria morchelliformis]|nr:hypothetical protein JB92DRAFT_2854594 [Gautieria morchelliformis]
MVALKYEENDKLKAMIRGKVTEFLARAEKLKEHLSKSEEKRSRSDDSCAGTATDPPPSVINALNRAIEMVQRGIDQDMNQNYAEAYKQYQNSLDYFMLALKYEKNDKLKAMIRGKVTEYLARAEKLKEHLSKSEKRSRSDDSCAVTATHPPPSGINALDGAIDIFQRAIDEDVNQNYAEAYKQYQNSLDYFSLALKF